MSVACRNIHERAVRQQAAFFVVFSASLIFLVAVFVLGCGRTSVNSEAPVDWPRELKSGYAQELRRLIPEKSIFFNGTHHGRLIASDGTHGLPLVITHTSLIHPPYREYLCGQFRGPGVLLLPVDVTNAFALADQRNPTRKMQNDDQVKLEADRILSRIVYERHKGSYSFYVDDGYVQPWMFRYLVPAGLVMKLESAPLQNLSPEIIEEDFKYWDNTTETLMASEVFRNNMAVRQAYANARGSIAGIYAYRELYSQAEHALKQAMALYPESSVTRLRLCDLYLRTGRFSEVDPIVKDMQLDPAQSDAAASIVRRVEHFRKCFERIETLRRSMDEGTVRISELLELLRLYGKVGRNRAFDQTISKIVSSEKMTTDVFKAIEAISISVGQPDALVEACKQTLETGERSKSAMLNLATAYLQVPRRDDAYSVLDEAVNIYGHLPQDIRNDDRFASIHSDERFQALLLKSKGVDLAQ